MFDNLKPIYFYLIALFFAFVAITFSALRIHELYTVISEFGGDMRTAGIFNISVIISGLFLTLGSVILCKENYKRFGIVRIILLLSFSLSLFFIGIFPLGISQEIHSYHLVFTAIFFIGEAVNMIAFSFLYLKKNPGIALVLLIGGIVNGVQLLLLFPNKQSLLSEFLSLSLTVIFILVISYYSSNIDEIDDTSDF